MKPEEEIATSVFDMPAWNLKAMKPEEKVTYLAIARAATKSIMREVLVIGLIAICMALGAHYAFKSVKIAEEVKAEKAEE